MSGQIFFFFRTGIIPIEIIRTKRRTIAIELKDSKRLILRAPTRVTIKEMMEFVDEKREWIVKTILKLRAAESSPDSFIDPVTDSEKAYLVRQAKIYIPSRVEYYAPIVGVTYGRITIRAQHTLFGSCTSKGNLSFNCMLMRMTPDIVDYVVVHELCHRLHMDHSREFWKEVGRVLPDYKERRKWLKENGRFYVESLNEEI